MATPFELLVQDMESSISPYDRQMAELRSIQADHGKRLQEEEIIAKAFMRIRPEIEDDFIGNPSVRSVLYAHKVPVLPKVTWQDPEKPRTLGIQRDVLRQRSLAHIVGIRFDVLTTQVAKEYEDSPDLPIKSVYFETGVISNEGEIIRVRDGFSVDDVTLMGSMAEDLRARRNTGELPDLALDLTTIRQTTTNTVDPTIAV